MDYLVFFCWGLYFLALGYLAKRVVVRLHSERNKRQSAEQWERVRRSLGRR